MSIHQIRNVVSNLDQDARMALAQQVLDQMSKEAASRIVPLNANHQEILEQQRKEERCLLVLALILAGASLTLALVLLVKGSKWIKQEVEKQVAAWKQEQTF